MFTDSSVTGKRRRQDANDKGIENVTSSDDTRGEKRPRQDDASISSVPLQLSTLLPNYPKKRITIRKWSSGRSSSNIKRERNDEENEGEEGLEVTDDAVMMFGPKNTGTRKLLITPSKTSTSLSKEKKNEGEMGRKLVITSTLIQRKKVRKKEVDEVPLLSSAVVSRTEKDGDEFAVIIADLTKLPLALGTLITDYVNDIHLTREQQVIIDRILAGHNVFFTGLAGTGKSFLIHRIIQALETDAQSRPPALPPVVPTPLLPFRPHVPALTSVVRKVSSLPGTHSPLPPPPPPPFPSPHHQGSSFSYPSSFVLASSLLASSMDTIFQHGPPTRAPPTRSPSTRASSTRSPSTRAPPATPTLTRSVPALPAISPNLGGPVLVMAMTGAAAAQIGGSTLHSKCGLGRSHLSGRVLATKWMNTPYLRDSLVEIRALLVDEVSMLTGNLFESLEEAMRILRRNSLPFGGVQLIFVGDFGQLGAIWSHQDRARYGPMIILSRSRAFARCFRPENVLRLTRLRRQTDPRLIKLLEEIRYGKLTQQSFALLDWLKRPLVVRHGIFPTRLTALRGDVEKINASRLSQLTTSSTTFTAHDTVLMDSNRGFLTTCEAPLLLEMKPGAQVMCTRNLPEYGLVNGSRGVFLHVIDDNHILLRFLEIRPHTIPKDNSVPTSPDPNAIPEKKPLHHYRHAEGARVFSELVAANQIQSSSSYLFSSPQSTTSNQKHNDHSNNNDEDADNDSAVVKVNIGTDVSKKQDEAEYRYFMVVMKRSEYCKTERCAKPIRSSNRLTNNNNNNNNKNKNKNTSTNKEEIVNDDGIPLETMDEITIAARAAAVAAGGPIPPGIVGHVVSGKGKFDYVVVARRCQFPLKLAWCMTIHKAQGMAISLLEVELVTAFAENHSYVALSRALTLQGLRVVNYHRTRSFKTCRAHLEFEHKYFGLSLPPVSTPVPFQKTRPLSSHSSTPHPSSLRSSLLPRKKIVALSTRHLS